MSTMKVNEILAADGTTTTPLTIPALDRRFCTAWVNFNGTGTVAIRDSYNVSSITDNGTGSYTANFAVPMANANYSAVGNAGDGGNFRVFNTNSYTLSSVDLTVFLVTPAVTDTPENMIQVFGGQ